VGTGQLIGPLVNYSQGSRVFSSGAMFRSLLNVIPGGVFFSPAEFFFLMTMSMETITEATKAEETATTLAIFFG
jgi:hypothetical protein